MHTDNPQKSTKRLVVKLSAIVVGMFIFGFALVPIYNVMCKTLGINGKTSGEVQAMGSHIDKSRNITVLFLATNNARLDWKFRPETQKIVVHPGENARIAYFAENNTNQTMTVQAIPSVSPGVAANYLLKTECFCFTQQTLKPHEKMDMPLLFHLDPDLPKNINTVTLSYTLFDVTKNANKRKVETKRQGKIKL